MNLQALIYFAKACASYDYSPHTGRPWCSDTTEEANKDIQSLPLKQGMFELTQMVIWPLWKHKRKTCKQPDCNMEYTHDFIRKM